MTTVRRTLSLRNTANDVEAWEIVKIVQKHLVFTQSGLRKSVKKGYRPDLLRLPLAQFGDVEAGECQRRRHRFLLVGERVASLNAQSRDQLAAFLAEAVEKRVGFRQQRAHRFHDSAERTSGQESAFPDASFNVLSEAGCDLFENGLVPDRCLQRCQVVEIQPAETTPGSDAAAAESQGA